MQLFDKIKSLCSENGMSVPQLEKALGFSNKAIYRWDENAPSITKVKAVADYFGVSVDYLLGVEEGIAAEISPDGDKNLILEAAFNDKPEMRMLFSVAENCTPEEIQQAIKIIEALKK